MRCVGAWVRWSSLLRALQCAQGAAARSYTLLKVQKAINFKQLADDHDLWPSTLHAINAGTLVRLGGLTEHGLQACTADAGFAEEEEAPEEEVEEAFTGIAGVNGVGGGIGPAGLRAPPRPQRGQGSHERSSRVCARGPASRHSIS